MLSGKNLNGSILVIAEKIFCDIDKSQSFILLYRSDALTLSIGNVVLRNKNPDSSWEVHLQNCLSNKV